MYSLEIKKKALKELKSLPRQYIIKIQNKIDGLLEEPRPHGCVKLQNSSIAYRIRVGRYRILYNIYDDVLIVEVIKVAKRGSVYDNF